MNKLHIKNCPLCGNVHLEKVFTCTDSYVSGEQFELVSCNKCHFVFTQDFPFGKDMDRYYNSSDYISHTDSKKGLIHSMYHCARKYMLRKKVHLVLKESHRKRGKLLDMGTGTGYFPDAMKKKGWDVVAVERNEQARDFARKKFGLEVQTEASFEQYASASFDVITLWHVLEHLEDLNRLWDKFHEQLTETGILLIAVPNHASYDAQYYGNQWAAYDVPRHLWHFVPTTIQQWGAKHGFVMAARYSMPFDAFYISMLSEKNKGNKLPVTKGMARGFWFWLKTLGRKDKGSSMIYVFRKKRDGK